jgi:hypothetical protein
MTFGNQVKRMEMAREPLIIQAEPGPCCWVLHPPTDPWGDGYVAVMRVELHDEGLDAAADVKLSTPPAGREVDLVEYFRRLCDDWRGWQGEQS